MSGWSLDRGNYWVDMDVPKDRISRSNTDAVRGKSSTWRLSPYGRALVATDPPKSERPSGPSDYPAFQLRVREWSDHSGPIHMRG